MRKSVIFMTFGSLPLLVGCGGGEAPPPAAPPATTAPAAAPAAAGSGSVSGKIAFDGAAPAPEKVKLSADPKCQHMHPEGLERQSVRVKDGGVADVLVYVKSGASGSYAAPVEPAMMDQKGCNYSPHVLAVQAGQPIKIRNSDDTLHNIHPRPTINAEFNIGQPRQGMESTRTFDKPELKIPVGCDVHPWMRSYVHVLGHPFYAVTGEDGSFEIKALPAGEYEIEALHEKLAPVSAKIVVKAGEPAKLDLTIKG